LGCAGRVRERKLTPGHSRATSTLARVPVEDGSRNVKFRYTGHLTGTFQMEVMYSIRLQGDNNCKFTRRKCERKISRSPSKCTGNQKSSQIARDAQHNIHDSLHLHAGLPSILVVALALPSAASRPALFCLRNSKARASISPDRSISSKLLTSSFTLPLLVLLRSGMSIAVDIIGGGDTARRSTNRFGIRGGIGIRLGGGACCRLTSSFG